MIAIGLLCVSAVVIGLEAPFWLRGLLALPGLLWGPGHGWARALGGSPSGLGVVLDAGWIGLGIAWLNVSLIRELGLEPMARLPALMGLCLLWALGGLWAARRAEPRPSTPRREIAGILAVVVGVLGIGGWRAADIGRPLDGGWYLEGAVDPPQEALPLRPAEGWAQAEPVGWEGSGAWRLRPEGGRARLAATGEAHGHIVLAVRGPLGSALRVQEELAEVQAEVAEQADEGPVRRYLSSGVAALRLPVDLKAGEGLELMVQGPEVWLFTGTDAIWAAHAEGALRYTHYYQLLNQVENEVWAAEVLEGRRFVWNQPPGWSPILAAGQLGAGPDLPGSNMVFLWVLALVGLSSVRLVSAVAPGAPVWALILPGLYASAHGLLMLEPGSTNFPDSLYAGALLSAAAALAERRRAWFLALALAAQALRWPGGVVCTIMALCWWVFTGQRTLWHLSRLWLGLGLGVLAAAGLAALGEAEDLGFILYFETFPEHWHDDYAASSLLPRAPEFYQLWLRYTGGGLALAALLALLSPSGAARGGQRAVLATALLYSLLLATVDHHPTHYFLPLVGLTGAAVAAGLGSGLSRGLGLGLLALQLLGLIGFLWQGQV